VAIAKAVREPYPAIRGFLTTLITDRDFDRRLDELERERPVLSPTQHLMNELKPANRRAAAVSGALDNVLVHVTMPCGRGPAAFRVEARGLVARCVTTTPSLYITSPHVDYARSPPRLVDLMREAGCGSL